MVIFEAILGRRSIRRFTDKPIELETLERILEAARWAPSDDNRQRWRFVVVQTPSLVRLVKRLSPGMPAVPACVVAVCSQRTTSPSRFGGYLAIADCAMAAQNILLAAHGFGIGSCVLRSFSSAGIRELLVLPDDVEPELLIALGYPKEIPEPPSRKPLSDVAFRDRYGQSW